MNRIFTLVLVLLTSFSGLRAQNPWDTTAFNIVVMGSSTAWGKGASVQDSAWVFIYSRYVKGLQSKTAVYNIAQAGTTTYDANPSWFNEPGKPRGDASMNITRALSYKPDGIIISFPNNDAAQGIPLDEQKANFNRIVAAADSLNIMVWICLPQPRNADATFRNNLLQLRDWMLTRFPSKTIDFWTPLADENGRIKTIYSSGDGTENDGIHVNNAAHRVLYQEVLKANLLDSLYNSMVRLVQLTATPMPSRNRITFRTHTERSLARFNLERSINNGTSWDSVGVALAKGGKPGVFEYAIDDNTPPASKAAYRLVAIDTRGRKFYTYNRVELEAGQGTFALAAFSGAAVNNTVQLNWTTTAENNLARYVIQHQNGQNWDSVGQKPAAGASAYSFVHAGTSNVIGNYRLMGRTNAGNTVFSESVSVKADSAYWNPFALASFKVLKVNDKAELSWSTTAEIKTLKFNIQRLNGTTWTTIASVNASGNSAALKNYQYADNLQTQDVYYRLDMESAPGVHVISGQVVLLYNSDPYVLSAYTAAADMDVARVNWSTTSEKNLKTITVEKSLDSAQWTAVKKVAAWGAYHPYEFLDSSYAQNTVYYRLNLEDGNSTHFYTEGIKVTPDPMYAKPYWLEQFYYRGGGYLPAVEWITLREKALVKINLEWSADSSNWEPVANGSRWATNNNSWSGYSVEEPALYNKTVYYRLVFEDRLGRKFYEGGVHADPSVAEHVLESFTGEGDFGSVNLKWKTSKEVNSKLVVLRRSSDKQTWPAISYQTAVNNINGKEYTYKDANVPQTPFYYRVGIEGTNGRTTYYLPDILVHPDSLYAKPYRIASITGTQNANQQTIAVKTSVEKKTVRMFVDRSNDGTNWAFGVDTLQAGTSANGRLYTKTYTYNISTTTNAVHYRVRFVDSLNRYFTATETVRIAADSNYANPFRLATFTATRQATKQSLAWSTAKEWNTRNFRIERRVSSGAWTVIDSVAAAGMSTVVKTYSFDDTAYTHLDHSYRLVMNDTYGRSFTSPIASQPLDTNYTTPVRYGPYSVKRELDKQAITWTTNKEWRIKQFRIIRMEGSVNVRIDSVPATGAGTYNFIDTAYKEKETYYKVEARDDFGRSFITNEMFVRIDSNYNTPVRWASVGGERVAAGQVINWATTKEFRSEQFAVQRKDAAGNWIQAGVVNAAGLAMTGKTYSFTDTPFVQAAISYRLQLTDLSGRVFNSQEYRFAADTNYTKPFGINAFTVAQKKDQQVISWSTYKEFNIESFEVQRQLVSASNGREMEVGWEVIATVPAKGGSSSYVYTDMQTQDKQVAYRVVAIDKLGRPFNSPGVTLTPDLSYRNAFNLKGGLSVARQNEKRLLQWTTATENGSLRFVIERSTDSVQWNRIDSILAKGTSDADQVYSFTDSYNTQTVWVYYRLVMVDNKGERKISNAVKTVALITANPDGPQQPAGKVFAYPNPVTSHVKIAGFANAVDAEIYNSKGIRVYQNLQYNGEAIHTSAWPAGLYFIILEKGKYRLSLIKM